MIDNKNPKDNPQIPTVKVLLYFHVRQLLGKKFLYVKGSTIKEVLQNLAHSLNDKQKNQFLHMLFTNNEFELNPKYRIIVNGRSISLLQRLETPLKEGDEIAIIPAVGGGKL